MIHVKQTKIYDAGPPVYRGNCLTACLASLFELPIEAVPESPFKQDASIISWLNINFPGISIKSQEIEPTDNIPMRVGYWLATVESPRYNEECHYHVAEGGTPMTPFWWKIEECPHCRGSGLRPGYHEVVANGRRVAHDPHPKAEGVGWGYNGRLCMITWFEVHDPSRLISRTLPAM